ncbi:MAG: secondary thiamine-phosphate synthase enzyme YjbQ [bacterium]
MQLTVSTNSHSQAVDITEDINNALVDLHSGSSGVHLWVPHTTAGITVNESNDPAVMSDLIDQLESVVPWDGSYDHAEGNAAAHIKSILLGSHQWVPVSDGTLDLGRWQGVFLLEWDGPRERTVQVKSAQ